MKNSEIFSQEWLLHILSNFDPLLDFGYQLHVPQAKQLLAQGALSKVRFERSPTGALVRGVLTEAAHEFACSIRWFKEGKRVVFTDLCECDEGGSCPHCLALLIAAKENSALTKLATPSATGMSKALEQWLAEFTRVEEPHANDFTPPPGATQTLYFVFKQNASTHLAELSLLAAPAAGARKAAPGPFNFYSPRALSNLSETEKEIVREIEYAGQNQNHTKRIIGGLIPKIITSGRAHFQSIDQPALTMGEDLDVEMGWEAQSDGTQRPVLRHDGGVVAAINATPVHVIVPGRATIHQARTDATSAALTAWLHAPSLTPSDAAALTAHLNSATKPVRLPAPRLIKQIVIKDETPMPLLRFFVHHELIDDDDGSPGWPRFRKTEPEKISTRVVRMYLIYPSLPDQRFVFDEPPIEVRALRENGDAMLLLRNAAAENERYHELLDYTSFIEFAEVRYAYDSDDMSDTLTMPNDSLTDWAEFFVNEAPKLERLGWSFEFSDDFNAKPLQPDAWYDEVESSGVDWFQADIGIELQGRRIPMLPAIAQWLAGAGKKHTLEYLEAMGEKNILIPLPEENTSVPFPAHRLHRILSSLTELFSLGPKALQGHKLPLHPLRAAQMAEDAGFASTNENLRQLADRLRTFSSAPAPTLPDGLKADLRPYQAEGFRWLQFLAAGQLGGILADDMGLGKTVQTLASLLSDKNAGFADRPSLIVAPKSVLQNWAIEAAKFTPALRTLIYAGKERGKTARAFSTCDLVITSYPILTRDQEHFATQEFHWIVLDEAQNIKNPKAKTTLAACSLQSRGRLCLTGTPMENHLGELWSIFHFLMPGFLGTQDGFNKVFRTPIEKRGDDVQRKVLARRIGPVMLRRTKEQVLPELPAKVETIQQIELSPGQKDLYESVRAVMDKKVREEIQKRGAERSQIMILDALLKLRQVCCHPGLLKIDAARQVTESAKLEALMEMVPQLVEEGRCILLFSQFTEMLAVIAQQLDAQEIPYFLLTGQTEDRQSLVDRFQAGERPVFLISLKAGGSGLNLTAADTVIHYDPWWNPAAENQATDRAHRYGQKKTVFVYKLICQNSIEEKILQLQQKKAELVASLLEGSGTGLKITEADVSFLLAPLTE